MSTLEIFLEDLYRKHIQFQLSNEEVEAVQTGVETLINRIVGKITTNGDVRLSISNLIKVGGFYEGTKIVEPNEFDFLVEMEDFKNTDVYRFEVACEQNTESVHCVVNKQYYSRWNIKEPVEGTLAAYPPQQIFKFLRSATIDAIDEIHESKQSSWKNELGCMQLSNTNDYDSGIFGPNVIIEMTWTNDVAKTSMAISADMTACIRCPEHITDYWEDSGRSFYEKGRF